MFWRISRPALRATRRGERHGRQALAQEDEVGGVAADIGGRGRRHRHMRGAQRRRVVEAVADHQHLVARRRSSCDAAATLSAGQQRRRVAVDAERRGHVAARLPRCRPTASRRHRPRAASSATVSRGIGAQRVLEDEGGDLIAVCQASTVPHAARRSSRHAPSRRGRAARCCRRRVPSMP